MDSNRNGQHALLTAAAGVTLAAGAFALVRSQSRQRLDTVQSLDQLQWLCGDDASSATARSLLQLDSAVRNVRICELKDEARGSLKRVSSFERLTGLQELDLQHAPLDAPLLASLAACSRLASLRAAHAGLIELPPAIGRLTALRSLDVSGNALTALPPAIGRLTALTRLAAARNRLAALPPEIGALANLQDLDVSRNALAALPAELGACTNLAYLNAMANQLEQLPPVLCNLARLYRLGLKSNRLRRLPEGFGRLTALVELFITDNQLVELPPDLGACTSLVKLQASFNQLASLPDSLAALPRLELCRVACCDIAALPAGLGDAPSLAWLSLGGNPVCAAPPPHRAEIADVTMDEVVLGAPLGDGASGDVFASTFRGRQVAVKVFKGEASPDGRAADEIGVTCAVSHPNLIKVLGLVQQPHALVVLKVDGAPLAAKPDLTSLLRCRWAPRLKLQPRFVLNAAASVAAALAELHRLNICHGDVYAHNVLADAAGDAVLCDYGASFFYQPVSTPCEAQEVRAFGLMLADMAARIPGTSSGSTDASGGSSGGTHDSCGGFWSKFSSVGSMLRTSSGSRAPVGAGLGAVEQFDARSGSPTAAIQLAGLAAECTQPCVRSRPSFAAIVDRLQGMSASVIR